MNISLTDLLTGLLNKSHISLCDHLNSVKLSGKLVNLLNTIIIQPSITRGGGGDSFIFLCSIDFYDPAQLSIARVLQVESLLEKLFTILNIVGATLPCCYTQLLGLNIGSNSNLSTSNQHSRREISVEKMFCKIIIQSEQ